MKNIMRPFHFASIPFAVTAFAFPLLGQVKPTTSTSDPNAASIYLQAFKRIPPGTDDILAAAAKAETIDWRRPIDQKQLTPILLLADPAIALSRRAAAIRRCDWTEVFAATQPSATQPADMSAAASELYQQETWELIALGGAEAAALFDQRRPDEGARCACDAMNLCARAPVPSGLLMRLVPPKLWESLDKLVADHITELSPTGLKVLQRTIRELPRVSSTDDPLKKLRDFLATNKPTSLPTTEEAQAVNFAKVLSESADLPADEFIVRMTAALEKMPDDSRGPLGLLVILTAQTKVMEDEMNVELALLEAAVDCVLNGPDAVKQSHDPSSHGKPFDYRKLGNGFELLSQKLDQKKKPITIEIGDVNP